MTLPAAERSLPHEKLRAYREAHALAVACDALSRAARGARPDLADQLRRASASIVLNIAEGAAETHSKEKARFYRMARRSANECLAILALLVDLALIPDALYVKTRAQAARTLWYTTRLTESTSNRR